ncbi:MAG: hypothetical protein AAFO01_20190 [Pseudomonadota bacterium]
MRAIALTLFIGFLAGFLMIEAFLRYDDYSSLAQDYTYHHWDGRDRRVMATAEDIADPRHDVVFLGDSMVAGVNCGREQNLVGQFETAMRHVAPNHKAINLGSANTSVFAYLDQLQGYHTGVGAPAGVIVMLYTNDADVIEPRMCPVIDVIKRADNLSTSEKKEIVDFCDSVVLGTPASSQPVSTFSIGGPVDRWFHGVSYAYRFIRGAMVMLAGSLGDGEPVGRLRYPGLWSNAESLEMRLITVGIEAIKAHADQNGTPLMIAFYPPVEFLSKDNPSYAATEIASNELRERFAVPVFNGFEAYFDDPRASRNMSRSLTDAHPSCLGHQILAEWLVEKFGETGGFENPSSIAQPASASNDTVVIVEPADQLVD